MSEKTISKEEFEAALAAAYKQQSESSEFTGFDRMIFLMSGMRFAARIEAILFGGQKEGAL